MQMLDVHRTGSVVLQKNTGCYSTELPASAIRFNGKTYKHMGHG